MDLEELVARERVRDLYAVYNRAGDKGRLQELAECFTEDGELEVHDYFHARGRGRIVRALQSAASQLGGPSGVNGRQTVRHHVSSLRFDTVERQRITSSAYFLVCAADRVDHWGTYRDQLVRAGGDWLIQYRSVAVDGRALVA